MKLWTSERGDGKEDERKNGTQPHGAHEKRYCNKMEQFIYCLLSTKESTFQLWQKANWLTYVRCKGITVWRMKESKQKCNEKSFRKKREEKQIAWPCFFLLLISKRRTQGKKARPKWAYNGIPVRTNYLFWLSRFFSTHRSCYSAPLSPLYILTAYVHRLIFWCPLCHYCRDTPLIPLNCLLTFGVKSLIKFLRSLCTQFICLSSCTPHGFCARRFFFSCSLLSAVVQRAHPPAK